jgi:8-oxo-dGTP pyrophosphatase MutT (NUDIX family)
VNLRQLLDQYQTIWPADAARAKEFADFELRHSDAYERTCVPGHFTASALITDLAGSKVLLTHHRKLRAWLQLGGHADGDKNLQNVALREAEEESGLKTFFIASCRGADVLDIDAHLIPAHGKEPAHIHYDVRFWLKTPEEQFQISDESLDLKWFSWDEAYAECREDSMRRLFDRVRAVIPK